MKEPIKKGDLVMVVRAPSHCLSAGTAGNYPWHFGYTFRVQRIYTNIGTCNLCGSSAPTTNAAGVGHVTGYEIARLIRIDPPAEQSTTDTPAELFA